MAKPTLLELQALPDPAQSDHFELIIPNPPGGGNAQALRVQCQQIALPGKSIEAVSQEVFGNQLQHAGRSTYSHDVSVTFIESRTLAIHKALRNWLEYCRRHDDQLGHYKNEYSRNVILNAFDQKGILIDEFTLYGFWPSQVPDVQFDGTASNIITIAATFQCDYWEPSGGFAR